MEIVNNKKGSSEMRKTMKLQKLEKMSNNEKKVWSSMGKIIQFNHKSSTSKKVSNGLTRIRR